jgi:hypothetical protein
MNYDFKTNWDKIIVPLLDNEKVKKSIKKGIKKYLNNFDNYDKNIDIDIELPAKYSSYDAPYDVEIYNELIEKNIIKGELIDIKYGEIIELGKKKMKQIDKYKKFSMRTYQLLGACHWWNETFCLTLAKLIYPNVKWYVMRGNDHTTIMRRSKKYIFYKMNIQKELLNDIPLVFDILYFDENDTFFGGCKAINVSDDANISYDIFLHMYT